jgi:outer membrane protein assembly factor BamB
MGEPRDLFRAGLEEEWGEQRERTGLETRVSQRLRGGARRRQPTGERVLALSAAGLGILLLAALGANTLGLLSSGRHGPPVVANPISRPAASPTAPAVTDYGPPPSGLPFFYYVDPAMRSWMVAVDWSGKPRGTLKLGQPIGDGGGFGGGLLSVAPDGSRIITGSQVMDSQGGATPGEVIADKQSYLWADDSRHLCYTTPSFSPDATGLPQTLMTLLPGATPRASVRVGTAQSQSGAAPVACSITSDRALVVQAYNGVASESWLVKLSTGAVLHHQTYPTDPARNGVRVVSSHDGAFIAANTTIFGTGPGGTATAGPSIIRSGLTGTVLATIPAGFQVTGFSWDGSLAVLHGDHVAGAASSRVQVVDWRTGRVLWQLEATKTPSDVGGGLDLTDVLAAPGGQDLALAFARLQPCSTSATPPTCRSTYDPLRDIIIVHGDGTAREVATRVHPVW